jgi:hypothetical protein
VKICLWGTEDANGQVIGHAEVLASVLHQPLFRLGGAV